jgi:altronate dehydratase large subunit
MCGCGQIGSDREQTMRTLRGYCLHPNVGGVLLVSLGCEQVDHNEFAEISRESGKISETIEIQKLGGTSRAIKEGVFKLKKMQEVVLREKRIKCGIENLIVGMECGGSDTTSGLVANPLCGKYADQLVEAGGTVILSETTEMIGAEHLLAKRIEDSQERERFFKMVKGVENSVIRQGIDLRGTQPSPGNIAGGITTIEEKSLGCIYKGGTAIIQGILSYSQRPPGKGLYLMDTPGQDVQSVTGMVAGGAQIILFTTGRGTPIGNPVSPVIKITGNNNTYLKMEENIDINAGQVLIEKRNIADILEHLQEFVMKVAEGSLTKAEKLGHREFDINRVGITL